MKPLKKLCGQCKHCVIPSSPIGEEYAECTAPENREITEEISVVTGEFVNLRQWRIKFCRNHRTDSWFWCRFTNTCGREGRWFEMVEPYKEK